MVCSVCVSSCVVVYEVREVRSVSEAEVLEKNKNPTLRMWGTRKDKGKIKIIAETREAA